MYSADTTELWTVLKMLWTVLTMLYTVLTILCTMLTMLYTVLTMLYTVLTMLYTVLTMLCFHISQLDPTGLKKQEAVQCPVAGMSTLVHYCQT